MEYINFWMVKPLKKLCRIIIYVLEVINRYNPVNKLPNVERDVALVMKNDVPSSEVIACILKSDKQFLTNAYVFDLYEGEIEENTTSGFDDRFITINCKEWLKKYCSNIDYYGNDWKVYIKKK